MSKDVERALMDTYNHVVEDDVYEVKDRQMDSSWEEQDRLVALDKLLRRQYEVAEGIMNKEEKEAFKTVFKFVDENLKWVREEIAHLQREL